MKKIFTYKYLLLVFFAGTSSNLFGQFSISTAGTAFTQNFNTLAITGSPTASTAIT